MKPPPRTLHLEGLKCPLPALRTERALRDSAPGAVLVVRCTDPLAVIDIPHLVARGGDALLGQAEEGGVLVFTIGRRGTAG